MATMKDGTRSRARGQRVAVCLAALVLASLFAGCQTCPRGKRWGKPCAPTWARLGMAAKNAVLDPYTWAPLAGAAVFALNEDWDREVSNWARRETPIFGSKSAASSGGKITRNIAMAGGLATAMGTPSGPYPYWGTNKAMGVAIQTAAALAPQAIVLEMKKATDRVRPSGKDDLSFPSTISSEAAAWSAMGRRNIREMTIPLGWRTAMEATLSASAGLTAWSRVENGSHYPTDVLVGLAIGNATSLFIQDLFLGPSWRNLRVGVSPARDAAANLSVGYKGKL